MRSWRNSALWPLGKEGMGFLLDMLLDEAWGPPRDRKDPPLAYFLEDLANVDCRLTDGPAHGY